MFETIIGHEKILDVLRRQVASGQLGHAYLFVGPEGVGRTAVAEGLVGEATRISRLSDEKTGKLKSGISVEQIRELRERLSMTSLTGGRKAVLIEEADYLSGDASDALLKTLEEPRGDTIIILRAPTVESVSATISSRCQVLRFQPVATKTIATALVKRGLDREEADRVATLSAGRPGIAIRLVTDGAYRAEIETATSAFETITSSSLPKCFALIAQMLPKEDVNKAMALQKILDAWEEAARQKMLAGDHRFIAVLDRIRESREAADHNVSPHLALEHVII